MALHAYDDVGKPKRRAQTPRNIRSKPHQGRTGLTPRPKSAPRATRRREPSLSPERDPLWQRDAPLRPHTARARPTGPPTGPYSSPNSRSRSRPKSATGLSRSKNSPKPSTSRSRSPARPQSPPQSPQLATTAEERGLEALDDAAETHMQGGVIDFEVVTTPTLQT